MRKKSKEINEGLEVKENNFSSRASKAGGFSLAACAIIFAIIIVINLIIPALPSKFTSFDLSAGKKFSIGSTSQKLIDSLKTDITIYYLCGAGEEDPYVTAILDSYANSGRRIKVETVDPVVNPKFTQQFTKDDVDKGSVIVAGNNKSKVVNVNDLYEYTVDYQSYQYQQSAFSAENMITNAIAYVISSKVPTVSFITGHGEAELDPMFTSSLTKTNYDTSSLNIASQNGIPEGTDCAAMIAPASDISAEDKKAIEKYVSDGGNLYIAADSIKAEDYPNFTSMLKNWGIETVEGIVIELDSSYCYSYMGQSVGYFLLPQTEGHEITDGLDGYYVMLPEAQGFYISEKLPDGVTAEPIFKTTEKAYSATKIEEKKTSELEDGDIKSDGGFVLGAAITSGKGKVVFISDTAFMTEKFDSAVAGANSMVFVNAFGWLCGKADSISIPSKSLSLDTITVNASTASALKVIFIFAIPAVIILTGIVVVVRRKKR